MKKPAIAPMPRLTPIEPCMKKEENFSSSFPLQNIRYSERRREKRERPYLLETEPTISWYDRSSSLCLRNSLLCLK